MGKMGGSSWLTAVKRAFRSPTKDSNKKSSRRKVEHRHEQDKDEKKTERKRWLFRKHSSSQQSEPEDVGLHPKTPVLAVEQRHAIAVAEAAVATAEAAMEIIRLTQPSNAASFKQHSAARAIQTAYRGYLSRKALVALKGIVKLQALIRGQNVRKQANMTMRCMQALLRVQARVRDQRARLSHDGGRRSMFAETSNLWESKYLKDIRDRKSRTTSRDGSSIADDWSRCPRTLAELEAILKTRNESALAHEKKSMAFAFFQQNKILDYDRMTCEEGGEEDHEVQNRENRLDGWLARRQSDSRASADLKRDSVKIVEIDSYRTTSNGRKSNCQSPVHRQSTGARASPHRISVGRTPPPPRPASPRLMKEEKCYSTANTPSLRSAQRLNCSSGAMAMVPNYMAATESARARSHSQSAPRQRPSTPERDRGGGGGSVRKRLSYPVPEPNCAKYGLSQNLRSPSFKSVQAGYVGNVGMEEQSNNSCYTESVGGEISPCSITDLRRWLR